MAKSSVFEVSGHDVTSPGNIYASARASMSTRLVTAGDAHRSSRPILLMLAEIRSPCGCAVSPSGRGTSGLPLSQAVLASLPE
ncbi:MAG: hypothetical protein FWE19_09995, partial [Oscillospiraceae bacterium]|nr:hypothetical protein [Oscillospiraceae bacterium]